MKRTTRPRNVVFLAYDDAQPIDLTGPLQTFAVADQEAGGGVYRLQTVSLKGGRVTLNGGLRIDTDAPPEKRPLDTLLIPGGPGVHPARENSEVVRLAQTLAQRADRVCSVCTGAFLLAEAGLLDGREVVTHWRSCDALAAQYPALHVDADKVWIRDGAVWTSAGVTAGIDLALALVEEDLGSAIAARVAKLLVVYMRRSGGQAQFSAPLALQVDESFADLVDWIGRNLQRDLQVPQLAARAGMSERTFSRRFVEKTGLTPAKAIENLRIERSQSLLATTGLSLSNIAHKVGFGREERFRLAFERRCGVGPSQWRERFSERP